MKKSTYAMLIAMIAIMKGITVQAGNVTQLDTLHVYGDRNRLETQVIDGEMVHNNYKSMMFGVNSTKEIPFTVVSLAQKAITTYSDPTQPLPSVLVNNPSVRSTACTFYDDFSIRGIRLNGYQVYLNGIPGLFGQGVTPTNFVSRIDVVAGPAMTTNLTAAYESTGGNVNLISGKADIKEQGNLLLQFSGKSTWTQKIDVSKRFGNDKNFGVRINFLNSGGQTAIPQEERVSQNMTIDMDYIGEKSSTNLFIGYINDSVRDSLRWFTFANDLKVVPNPPDIHRNYGFKALRWEADKYIATINHSQELSKNFSMFVNAGYGKYDVYNASNSDWRYTIQKDGTFKDGATRNPFALETKVMQLGLTYNSLNEQLENNFTVAVDKYWQKNYGSTYWTFGEVTGSLEKGILTEPDVVPPYPYKNPYLKSETIYTSWKAIDRIKFDKWNFMAGIVRKEVNNKNGNKRIVSHAISPLGGVVYRVNDQISIYGSHSESFGKGTAITNDRYINKGEILPPAKTKQNEMGIRYSTGKLLMNFALFKTCMANAIDLETKDPQKFYRKNDGEAVYKGVDWSIFGKLNDHWSITGGVLYVDAKVNRSTKGTRDGHRVDGVPQFSGVMGLEFTPNEKITGIVRMIYSGSYYIKNEKYKLPGYTTIDLGVKYKSTLNDMPVSYDLMIYNLLDKAYWESLPGGDNLILSMPRSVSLSMTLKF